jgi:hypothetical protein
MLVEYLRVVDFAAAEPVELDLEVDVVLLQLEAAK